LISNDTVQFLDFLVRTFIPPQFAELGRTAFKPVSDHKVFDLAPFLHALFLDLPSYLSLLTRKRFRTLCSTPTTSSLVSLPRLNTRQWSFFWTFPLSQACRTVWYRVIHEKLPTRQIMHNWLPASFASPACPLCQHDVETFEHFIFSCPLKLSVWQLVWNTFFVGPVDLSVDNLPLQQSVLSLSFPPLLPSFSTSEASVIIGSTLLCLWRAHWKFIFDAVPFSTSTIFGTLLPLVHKSAQESLVQKGIPHRPLPFFEVDGLL
ncbi:hypothetical protein BD560DRAFT_329629, partial [Blakeslea trispora]